MADSSDNVVVPINPMAPSADASDETSWTAKIERLRHGPLPKWFLAITVLLAATATLCDGFGAGIVAKGLLTETAGFACCTTSACNYGAESAMSFFGAKTDPTKVNVTASGVCTGPPRNGAVCDGSQCDGGQCQGCGPNSLNYMYEQGNSSDVAVVYFKLETIAFSLFAFLYLVYYRADWHENGEKNCCCCPENKDITMTPQKACKLAIRWTFW